MCFYSDSGEVRVDGELVRLIFHVDGDAVCQVAIRTCEMDDIVTDYLRLLGERDGRAASILAYRRGG